MTNWKISGTRERTVMILFSKQNYRVKYALGRVMVSYILLLHWKTRTLSEVASLSAFVVV